MDMATIAIGDLYQIEGRRWTTWAVDAVVRVPRTGTMVRLAHVGGVGRVTFHVSRLSGGHGFQRV